MGDVVSEMSCRRVIGRVCCQIIAESGPDCSISSGSRPCGKDWRPVHCEAMGARVAQGATKVMFKIWVWRCYRRI